MDVIIVCHTEFGFVKGKDVFFDKNSVASIREATLNLANIADKYGARVSFAVCPETASYFPKSINHEIGLHVHPGWRESTYKNFKYFVGDKYLRENCKQSTDSTVLRDFSFEEQSGMISKGKQYLKSQFGLSPKFFLAGKWSLNNNTIKALIENGFTHDCSGTARFQALPNDWDKLPRICMPYRPDSKDYQREGNLPFIIIPVSQYFPKGNVNPEVVHRVGLPWLKACFVEYYKQNLPVFHICLHSPCMTDSYFISEMDKFISFISKHKNVNFKFVSEIKEYPEIKAKTNILPYIFAINKNIIRTFFKI